MAGIILSTICAVALGTAALPASADTTDIYMIDNVEVKNFDGSQLNGRTISTYNINRTTVGSEPVRVHIIKTVPFGKTIRITPEVAGPSPEDLLHVPIEEMENPVFFLDGARISELAFKSMAVKDIANIESFKAAAASEYLQRLKDEGKYDGTTEGRDVIVVTTKPGE